MWRCETPRAPRRPGRGALMTKWQRGPGRVRDAESRRIARPRRPWCAAGRGARSGSPARRPGARARRPLREVLSIEPSEGTARVGRESDAEYRGHVAVLWRAKDAELQRAHGLDRLGQQQPATQVLDAHGCLSLADAARRARARRHVACRPRSGASRRRPSRWRPCSTRVRTSSMPGESTASPR